MYGLDILQNKGFVNFCIDKAIEDWSKVLNNSQITPSVSFINIDKMRVECL